MYQDTKRINESLRQKIAILINQLVEFPDGLITITSIDLSGDGLEAQVNVSVLPTHLYGTALRQLRKLSAVVAKTAAKQCRLSRIPKIVWLIDDTAERVSQLDEAINQAF